MTFTFEKERMAAVSEDGIPVGTISFPQINPGLVNISHMTVAPKFRGQDVRDRMMEALLTYLSEQKQKAALTCPYAQQYVRSHAEWSHILPGNLHFTTH